MRGSRTARGRADARLLARQRLSRRHLPPAVRGLARAPAGASLALDKFGHDRALPGHQQLAAPARPADRFHRARRPAARSALVGHSLGGFLSLLAASHRPDAGARRRAARFADPVAGWLARARAASRRPPGLAQRYSPGAVSRRRRQQWPDRRRRARAFRGQAGVRPLGAAACCTTTSTAASSPTTRDGVRAGASARDRDPHLRHAAAPHRAAAAPPAAAMPARLHRRQRSRSRCARSACAATRAARPGRIGWIEGTHLFPFERPGETAAAVLAWLRAFGAELAGRGRTPPPIIALYHHEPASTTAACQ